MKVLGLDIGYGHIKVVFGTESNVTKQFKFPSVIGITKRNEFVSDTRIYDFHDHSYYVGENALHLPSENLIDITEYKNLQYYAPLFLYHALQTIQDTPDVIVTGLSKAQIQHSGHFQENLQSFKVGDEQFTFEKVSVLPQGAGSKLTIDRYGSDFPNIQKEFSATSTYVGCDIGFNTLDMFMVTDGKTSPTLFEGIEKEGIMKIASKIAKKVRELHQREITLHEAQQVLDTGYYKLRGTQHPFQDYIAEVKKEYLRELLALIESKYGKVIDKCDFISLSGGGSAIFKQNSDQFIRAPKSNHEYYNAIGFWLYGCR